MRKSSAYTMTLTRLLILSLSKAIRCQQLNQIPQQLDLVVLENDEGL